jgi:hypothetical protein
MSIHFRTSLCDFGRALRFVSGAETPKERKSSLQTVGSVVFFREEVEEQTSY